MAHWTTNPALVEVMATVTDQIDANCAAAIARINSHFDPKDNL